MDFSFDLYDKLVGIATAKGPIFKLSPDWRLLGSRRQTQSGSSSNRLKRTAVGGIKKAVLSYTACDTIVIAKCFRKSGTYVEDRKYEVRCIAKPHGELHVRTESLSVSVSQAILRNGAEEMWNSVLIICQRDPDGAVITKVIVSHPDWDQNLQIAAITSSVAEKNNSQSGIECDLKVLPL